jgi:hypothetical protein
MTETLGKIPRQPLIQCWGCKGDHMYRVCPRISERVRNVHNVQQFETVEDMDINLPKIYVAPDKNQVEFQSHMIEVEGKINNQPIVILIDSRSSHIYLDPKMVGIFHLPRNKLGKSWLVQLVT